MNAYSEAIKSHPELFADKVVLDVGTGTGVLSVWAAQAGARKVYAVEASGMAASAEKIIQQHNVSHVVTVLHSLIEELQLPEPVDIIISEWMGQFLIKESMFSSVIHARDRFLKPNGLMFPAQGRMYITAISDPSITEGLFGHIQGGLVAWARFVKQTYRDYELDYSSLSTAFESQKVHQMLRSHLIIHQPIETIASSVSTIMSFDMHTASPDEMSSWSSRFSLTVEDESLVINALLVWFDVDFGPADVILSTSPYGPMTHWRQTGFVFDPPLQSVDGVVAGVISVVPSKKAKLSERFYDVSFTSNTTSGSTRVDQFELGTQLWARYQGGWISIGG